MVETGALLGRYSLERRLASGGMGTVYEARDERLARRVAVKFMRPELASDPVFVERFRREARAAAALSHPNIAAIFDYGEDDGRPFIVMELIQGRDLARVLREHGGPLPPARGAAIALGIADALAHAHAGGVVHRDVKPANVIVGPNDTVKVTDFGIARASGDETITGTGSVMGTAQYIAPEQASGHKTSPATDVYALGVVLFEMLTGRVPFSGESPVAVAMKHASAPVPVPSTLNPDVPAELDDVVATATAKDPAARFRDGQDVAEALVRARDRIAGAMAPAGDALDDTAAATRPLPPTVWPIPGDRYDPHRIGRYALIVLAALGVVAAGLVAFRLAAQDGDRPRRESTGRAGGPGPRQTVRSQPPDEATIRDGVIGLPAAEVARTLQAAGYEVELVSEESKADPGEVIGTRPPPGATVSPGDTITLIVSAGEEEDDGDGPGSGEEKGKGKGKGKDKDD